MAVALIFRKIVPAMNRIALLYALLFPFTLIIKGQQSGLTIRTKQVASGLVSPVSMATAKDDSGRLFICEQTGKIRIVKNGKLLEKPFLDVRSKLDDIGKVYSEKGLLGLAFHPDYRRNGRFFVYYSAPANDRDSDHRSVVAEYKVSADPDVADGNSEYVIMSFSQPESNHNGGQIEFGPDGYLYIGSGDGGGAGDEHGETGNGQDLSTFLGKILRINVNGTRPYSVPADNPFVKTKGAKPEIWAYGLRNPWRFSFDRANGRLFCADVGQHKWEEIDIIKKGGNYGWRIMEGNHCYNPESGCNQSRLGLPIAEYDHDKGISVTGGYVYRGKKLPALQGRYVFGDWKGKMYFLEEKAGKFTLLNLNIEGKKDNDLDLDINSFGEDENGELYILCQKITGTIMANGSLLLIEQAQAK
jgi:glucose/arabinose dehydrogenase